MALALDASTPVATTNIDNFASGAHSVSLTTASFTPPAGSVIVVALLTNAGPDALSAFAVTDNLGSHLTYTHLVQQGNNTNDTQANVWWAPVSSSAAMTVSASYSSAGNGGGSPTFLRVLVFTGADLVTPIGSNGGGRGRTTNLSGAAAQYSCTRGGSWGWVTYSDWTQSGVPTVPGAETVDASFDTTGQDSYAVIKNSAVTSTTGTTVTLVTSTPTASLQVTWMYFEILPNGDPIIGSVSSGTALSTPAFTAKFLFFDTGDYGIGV